MSRDLSNNRYGNLTVIKEIPHKEGRCRRWLCLCDCGNQCEAISPRLKNGTKTHCGCKTKRGRKGIDITGQKFRMLTALHSTDKRDRNGSVIWLCRCDCGNEVEVAYEELRFSGMVSCGCYRKERAQALGSNYIKRVAGTSIDYLEKAKNRKDNKSGVRGVFFFRDKYIAEISFQGKCYRLGKFDRKEEAIEARKRAEQILHVEFLDFYKEWKEKAEKDPEWAEQNPISVKVKKISAKEFDIIMEPCM